MDRKTVPAWTQHSLGPDKTRITLNWPPDGDSWWRTAEWLRAHGIDPKGVPVPGWLEIDEAERTVRYRQIVTDEAGIPLLADANGDPVPYGRESEHVVNGDLATRVVVVQLDAAPQPWPEAAATYDPQRLEDA